MADADEVSRQASRSDFADRFSALVPNQRGLDRALATNLPELAVFMSASRTHNKRNINKDHDETFDAFKPVFEQCAERGIRVRAYVSTVWGCPYEGDVSPQVVNISERLLKLGAYQISLGDTIGIGDPKQTHEILDAVTAGHSLGLNRYAHA